MSNPISDEALDRLLSFVGYGTLNASTWFIGMEEAGAGDTAIRIRSEFHQVEDCAEAHKKLGIEKHHRGPRAIQRTWRGMCHIMLAMEGMSPTRENIRSYQADCLGSRNGMTLLAELMPLPRPAATGWDYAGIIPQFHDAGHYFRTVKPNRVVLLGGLIARHKPEFVICYGKHYWPKFESLFDGTRFFTEGAFRIGSNSGTTVLLTSHFVSRAMNGKFDDVTALLQRERRKPRKN